MAEREVVKCLHCKLNQFRTEKDVCRRCGKSTKSDPQPVEPEPVIKYKPLPREDELLAFCVRMTLLRIRTQKNMSQNQLANRMGVARTFICKVEHSKEYGTPALLSMVRFSHALDVPLWQIIQQIESMMNDILEQRDKEKAASPAGVGEQYKDGEGPLLTDALIVR